MKCIEVCAAIILKENKFFISKRSYGEFAGYWEFPGGKIEIKESKHDCIIREIKEELDADINVIELLSTITYQYPTFHIAMHNFICVLKSDHLLLNEHSDGEFISIDDIDKYNFIPADIQILDQIKNYLTSR